MTDYNDNNRNNTPEQQPETAAPEMPAQQPPVYQQSYYQPPQYTQAPQPDAAPVQPDPAAQNGGYQPPQYTQQYQQPPYQQPYQQPYPQNPYGQGGYQQNPYPSQKAYTQKSRIAAALLAIMFGTFGVHNFYIGRIGIGIAQLAITVVSCGFLSVASLIWGIVEGIQLLQGKRMLDGHNLPFID